MNRRAFLVRSGLAALAPVLGPLASGLPRAAARIELIRDPVTKLVSLSIDRVEMWRGHVWFHNPALIRELLLKREALARGIR